MVFQVPAFITLTIDLLIVVLYFNFPGFFQDTTGNIHSLFFSKDLKLLRSNFMLVVIAAVRFCVFVPYVIYFLQQAPVLWIWPPRIWLLVNFGFLVLRFSVMSAYKFDTSVFQEFQWILLVLSFLSISCQHFCFLHLRSSASVTISSIHEEFGWNRASLLHISPLDATLQYYSKHISKQTSPLRKKKSSRILSSLKRLSSRLSRGVGIDNDDVFVLISAVFAHGNIIDGSLQSSSLESIRLNIESCMNISNISEVKFFIPQFGIYIIHSNNVEIAAELLDSLFIMCRGSLSLCHRLYWFLNSFYICDSGELNEGTISSIKNFLDLLQCCGEVAAVENLTNVTSSNVVTGRISNIASNGDYPSRSANKSLETPFLHRAIQYLNLSPSRPSSESVKILDRTDQVDGISVDNSCSSYDYVSDNYVYDPSGFSSSPSRSVADSDAPNIFPFELCRQPRGSFYEENIKFWSSLCDISKKIIDIKVEDRKKRLQMMLEDEIGELLPSCCVFSPVGEDRHRIWSIVIEECFAFSTKSRAPVFLCLEVVDFGSKKNKLRRSSWWNKGLRTVRSSIGSIIGSIGNIETSPISTSPQGRSRLSYGGVDLDDIIDSEKNEPKRDSFFEDAPLLGVPIDINAHQSEFVMKCSPSTYDSPLGHHIQRWSPLTKSGNYEETKELVVDHDIENNMDSRSSDQGSLNSSANMENLDSVSENPPVVVFKEKWAWKEERIRLRSSVGHLPGWRLLPVIVKTCDDLRQEQVVSQMIALMHHLLLDGNVDFWLRPYDIIAFSDDSGVLEAIPDTLSLDGLKKTHPQFGSLNEFFKHNFPEETCDYLLRVSEIPYSAAVENFTLSLASYSVICFLLQVKDRHNGNILIDALGHIIHIDFGFVFGLTPGRNMGFESAPFKLTIEMIELMGGPQGHHFYKFRECFVKVFMELRKSHEKILLALEIIARSNDHLPCFSPSVNKVLTDLRARFFVDVHDQATIDILHDLINQSMDNWTTSCYDHYQRCCVGIF